MDHLREILIAGGIVFWAYIVVSFIVFVGLAVNECAASGVALIVAFFIGLRLLFGVETPGWLPHTVAGWLLIVAAYLPVGVAWSIFKFYSTYREAMQEFAAGKAEWEKDERRLKPAISDTELSAAWNEKVDFEARYRKPEKDQILSWIAGWPVSVVYYLLADFLRGVLNRIYAWFSGVYDHIAKRITDSIKAAP
jgi:hypothetical protein